MNLILSTLWRVQKAELLLPLAAKGDEYLNARAKPGRFTRAVLLARGDKVLFRKAYAAGSQTKRKTRDAL